MGWKRRVAVAFTTAAALDAFVACYDWDLAADGGGDGSIDALDGAIGDGGLDANDIDVVVPEGGCTQSQKCDSGLVCTYADHKCGSGDRVGTCVAPAVCLGASISQSLPACACDNQIYKNPCMAGQAGEDLNVNGCPGDVDASFFQCGFTYCERTVEFCVKDADGGFACDKYNCGDGAALAGDCACAKAEVCSTGTCPGATTGTTATLELDCP